MAMLRAPGPTTCPPEVLSAMAKQMVGLSNAELPEVINFAAESISYLLFSQPADLYVCLLAASGTGAMEAAVCNFLSPGDRALVCSCGIFGERFAEIASAFGLKVQLLSRPYGYAFGRTDFEKEFKRSCKIFGEPKAVFFTHNETSTGVTNPIEQLADVVGKNAKSLVIVDATSSFAITPLKMLNWGIDVVLGGVQKGLMTPPGLSFVAFNEYAMQAYKSSTMPRYYFDFGKYVEASKKGQTPFTPAISQLRALKEAASLICKKGLEIMDVYDRHRRLANYVRQSIERLGLEVFAKECFSDGVTAVKIPEGLKAEDIIRVMYEEHDVELAGGPGELAGKIVRIGHMGHFNAEDISDVFITLEKTLNKLRKRQENLVK